MRQVDDDAAAVLVSIVDGGLNVGREVLAAGEVVVGIVAAASLGGAETAFGSLEKEGS